MSRFTWVNCHRTLTESWDPGRVTAHRRSRRDQASCRALSKGGGPSSPHRQVEREGGTDTAGNGGRRAMHCADRESHAHGRRSRPKAEPLRHRLSWNMRRMESGRELTFNTTQATKEEHPGGKGPRYFPWSHLRKFADSSRRRNSVGVLCVCAHMSVCVHTCVQTCV